MQKIIMNNFQNDLKSVGFDVSITHAIRTATGKIIENGDHGVSTLTINAVDETTPANMERTIMSNFLNGLKSAGEYSKSCRSNAIALITTTAKISEAADSMMAFVDSNHPINTRNDQTPAKYMAMDKTIWRNFFR
jgi:hypothetical protein